MKMFLFLFLVFLISPFIQKITAQNNEPTFEHLSLEKGISHNLTRCIYQDSKGFMWFGTMFGLIKFDGHKYTTYQNHPSDSLSISHDDILCLYEDKLANLWVGTRGGGLNKFDRNLEKFSRYVHDPADTSSLSNNNVNTICEDSKNNLWIGTEKGLNQIEDIYHSRLTAQQKPGTLKFKHFLNDLWDISSLSDDWILALYEDSHGNLWIGTQNGLNQLNLESKKFKRYHSFNPLFTKVYHPQIYALIEKLKSAKRLLAEIKQPRHFENLSLTFEIKKITYVLVYALGEGRSEFRGEPVKIMSDFGWLQSKDRQVIWSMNFEQSNYAGGAEKNRIQIEVLKLDPGKYELKYQSDDSHGYDDWNNRPPERPDDWGIHIYELNSKQVQWSRELLKARIPTQLNSVSSNAITAITKCAGNDQLWIGTAGGGLNKFDVARDRFVHFKHEPDNPHSLVNDNVNTIFEDEECSLWIGTSGGVSRYDPVTGRFTNYVHNPLNSNSLGSNFVYAIYRDLSGILWFGTYWGGIDKLDFKKHRFKHIRRNLSSSSKLAENNYQAICGSDHTEFWIGTWGDGLILYNQEKNSYINYIHQAADYSSLSNDFVRTLYKDKKNNLWIGTYGGGLNFFDRTSNSFKHYFYDNRNPNSLSSNFVTTILEDRYGDLWVGTENGGLNRLRFEDKTFQRFQPQVDDPGSISANTVYCLFEDLSGQLWIGTSAGLLYLDREEGHFFCFRNNPGDVNSLSNNYVYTIYQAQKGRDSSLWIGTAGGLNRFDFQTKKFLRFTEENGLPNRVICGILEDDHGFLWISTNKGLSRFDPKMKIFRNYDLADGLQSNMFNIGSYFKFPNGELAFGGINGLNLFSPSEIISNTFVPPVYLTGFRRFNQPMDFGKALSDLQEITLNYTDNFFTIEFAALDYCHPEKNLYAYKLEGVNDRWIHCENENFASYTNIDPGRYKFRVRGTNSDGVWNMEGASIDIIIQPPFWMSWWFRTMIIVLITFTITAIVYLVIRREKQKTLMNKKLSELKLQALQAQMNPHFIFNTINAIQYFISKKDRDSAYFYLSKFSKLLRRTLENSERLTVSLAEELETLKLYLELQLLRYENKFSYQIDVDSKIDIHGVDIPNMVLQPYIENAIQHGFSTKNKDGRIDIALKLNKKFLVCIIEDNGIGIRKALEIKQKKALDHTSSGMKLTRERLEIMNAAHKNQIDVSVQDLSEVDEQKKGTRVMLHIPIK